MKKTVLVLMIALMGTIMTNAQPQRHHGSPEQMVQQRVERLAKVLDLTEEQQAEVTKIYTTEMESMAKERPAHPGQGQKPDDETMKAQHEKMTAQHEATDAKIEALLTPEQAAKFAELKQHNGERGHDKKHRDPRPEGQRPDRGKGCCNGCDCKSTDKK